MAILSRNQLIGDFTSVKHLKDIHLVKSKPQNPCHDITLQWQEISPLYMTDINDDLAARKFKMLQLAEQLGNVSEACRIMGYSRQQFYKIRKAFLENGFGGLQNRKPIPKYVHNKKSTSVESIVFQNSLNNPKWGQGKIAEELLKMGVIISPGTVRNIRIRRKINTYEKRLLMLEEAILQNRIKPEPRLLSEVTHYNPAFKERHNESPYPGYLLCYCIIDIGYLKGIGWVNLQAAVDTYSSLAFAEFQVAGNHEGSDPFLKTQVMRFFENEGVQVLSLLKDESTLSLNPLSKQDMLAQFHQSAFAHFGASSSNGFTMRFKRHFMKAFFATLKEKHVKNLPSMQTCLNAWLKSYNYERPLLGYRNMGKTPFEFHAQGRALIPRKMKRT